MKTLQKHHIVDLFVWVDDTFKSSLDMGTDTGTDTNTNTNMDTNTASISKPTTTSKLGRPPMLSRSETLTILIWDAITEPHKTLRDTYNFIYREYGDCFPKMPSYKSFVLSAHAALESMTALLAYVLDYSASLRFVDSTMLEVCKLARADSHRVAKGIAQFGANHQGWHYGFKLHASINKNKQFSGLYFTTANEYDAQYMAKILHGNTKTVVGDSHYGASVIGNKLRKERGLIVITPPHYKQKKKLATPGQIKLLKMRTKIEAVFDYLKEHMHLVSSFPRSVKGYFVHYLRILLGYQVRGLIS